MEKISVKPGESDPNNKITVTKGEGHWELKKTLTDEELRSFVEDAKKVLEDAGVPDDVPAVDFAAEAKKIVDNVLGPE